MNQTSNCFQARRFPQIFGEVQFNNQSFFGKISRILFALLVHRRFFLHCLYVAIAHFCDVVLFFVVFFFGGICRLVD